MKICVYTCITGSYDKVNELKFKEPGIDYFLFTNNKKIKSNTWKVIHIQDKTLSNTKLARKIKIMGHNAIKDYDLCVWIDGNIIIKSSIKKFLDDVMKKEDKLIAFKHSERNTIADEMDACIKYKKESISNIDKLKKFYKKEKFKDDCGLIESTVYVKMQKDPTVSKTMKLWFDMIKNYTERDQLSFNYAISKTKLKVKWINKSVWNNEWFKSNKHKATKQEDEYKVYVSEDSNYSEENIVKGKYTVKDKIYTAKFNNPVTAKEIRFDPTEVNNLKVTNVEIKNVKKYQIEYHNCIKLKDTIYFVDTDPYFIIKGSFKENQNLEMTMKLAKINAKDIDALMKEYKKQNDQLKSYEEKINRIENTLIWRIFKKISKIFKRNDK